MGLSSRIQYYNTKKNSNKERTEEHFNEPPKDSKSKKPLKQMTMAEIESYYTNQGF